MAQQKVLYAVELDISREAGKPPGSYWVIHAEEDEAGNDNLCVYVTKKEAQERAKGCDHNSRVVTFTREGEKK